MDLAITQPSTRWLVNSLWQRGVHSPRSLRVVFDHWCLELPIMLTLMVLVGAIATGNAAIIKPSELALATAELLERILPKYLDEDCYRIVNGGAEVAQTLLKQRFDHILYTGSQHVAKIVLRAAAEHLTPVTLELGGKSPVFVDNTVNVGVSAKRVAWAKLMNCGQTCIAPDYVLCHADVKEKFIEEVKKYMTQFYGENPKEHEDYGRIINERHFDRLNKLMESQKKNIVHGGKSDRTEKFIEPTVFDDITFSDPIMKEEIFGPLLPIVSVQGADEAIKLINSGEKPLALYVFTGDKRLHERFMKETSSGSLMFNELLIQATVPALPFGGVGHSGMGSYHGNFTLEALSHKKACIIDPRPVPSGCNGNSLPPFSKTKKNITSMLTKVYSKSERRFFYGIKIIIVVALMAVALKLVLA
ncbi:putative fatty aldehyde dehydrogenase isoform X2 [Apostichopus japonicus]|uniref:Aldehyde dehydrogenase n=1 Tax=Stichopus japonicus TaxID=307972 RepID=A0A2G8LR47_STIJA|nr:putative fatty aldehyde dehydrogenase isoform X2 [Apostichopus japonicus]